MDLLPIVIPAAPAVPRRAPLPILAALVPVAGGVVLWLVTGSILSLCFAALGPLMLVAAAVDARRSRRAARRREEAEEDEGWRRAEAELRERHDAERATRRHRDPDAAAALSEPPLREGRPPGADTRLVVGSGTRASAVRATGGDGDRARDFQLRCGRLERAPVTTEFRTGIALRGNAVLVDAAARAFAVQLCARFGAVHLRLMGAAVQRLGLGALPHARASGATPYRLDVVEHGGAAETGSDASLWLLPAGAALPDGITCVVDITDALHASVRTPEGVVDVTPEFLSRAQVVAATRALDEEPTGLSTVPDSVRLSDLHQTADGPTLPAAIGRDAGAEVTLDLVDDGPHAIVTGTTGSGKSELLVSWVAALASAHGPERVVFVLADFKGGTAFEQLRPLPHVVALVTDLDPAGARRGVSSLTAELRRREAVLAAAGVRDVAEVDMARLVIVVDEFAALLQDHADLANVFTDIAARGRALGMHLILGTQRAAGVVRDALAANCPLRVSLRVGEAADSRAVIGSDAAAGITGGPESRGLAFVRRPRDVEARLVRVALSRSEDVDRAAGRWTSSVPPRSPWLPPLPAELPLAELRSEAPSGTVILGRGDDPDRQTQPLELLGVGDGRGIALIGQSGSGRSSALRAIAAQVPDAVQVPGDPEGAWDVVTALAADPQAGDRTGTILCDDLDAQLDALPPEHAAHLARLWEQIVRARSGATIVLTATRTNGAAGRILDLLPRRALLRTGGRTEHLAAGGDVDGFLRDRPRGRARIDDREVQIAWVAPQRLRSSRSRRAAPTVPTWRPDDPVTAVVDTGSSQLIAALSQDFPDHVVGSPADLRAGDGAKPMILVADADIWQREWGLWQRIRSDGEVVIRAENPAELRQLTGIRELPPYARPHAGRGWAVRAAEPPRRVIVDAWRPR